MKPPRYEDDIVSEVEAWCGCLVKALLGIIVIALICLYFTGCATATVEVRDGKHITRVRIPQQSIISLHIGSIP